MVEQNFAFPPRLRLTTPTQYKQVFDQPFKNTDRYFTVLYIRNDCIHPRLGLAIAKKNIKKAVNRNTIKRTIRESFRLSQHQLGCIDIVVIARRDAANVSSQILALSLQKHWRKLIDRCIPKQSE